MQKGCALSFRPKGEIFLRSLHPLGMTGLARHFDAPFDAAQDILYVFARELQLFPIALFRIGS